jgi:hypothetical protein
MTEDELASAVAAAAKASTGGDFVAAYHAIRPLLIVQHEQREAALALLHVVNDGLLEKAQSLVVLTRIRASYSTDMELMAFVGDCLEGASEIDFLNRAPPEDPLFEEIVEMLSGHVDSVRGTEIEIPILRGMATAARMMARQHDDLADKAYRRLVKLLPQRSGAHYAYGLFLKTRGRFGEGLAENTRAAELAQEPSEAVLWNLGICATGAAQGEIALQIWKSLGNNIEMGRFGLPEGGYSNCKVRLAERPLAERDSMHDEPGLEETIWIERLSPCHGIVRSVLYQDIGVDYGDVILIDGAPITYHRHGENSVPVFPHLATLSRRSFQFFDFAGIQTETRQLAELSTGLSGEAIVYSHTESYNVLCLACWHNSAIDHQHEETLPRHVVRGRIAVPPDWAPKVLVEQIDALIAARPGCELYSPALYKAAGLPERAADEQRKFDLLRHSGPEQ